MSVFNGRNDRKSLEQILQNLESANYNRFHIDKDIVSHDIQKQGYHFTCVDLDDSNGSFLTYIILAFTFQKGENPGTVLDRIRASEKYTIVTESLTELKKEIRFNFCGEMGIGYYDFDSLRICLEVDNFSFPSVPTDKIV